MMNVKGYALIVVALILNACGFSKTSDLVGEWGGKQCPITFELKPDGTVEYSGSYSAFNGPGNRYEVEGNNVVIYGSSDPEGVRFEKEGNILSTAIGNTEMKCEKQ